MGYYFRTNLSCTNPELIESGSTFNQKTYSEIIGTNGNEIHYINWKATMYDEVIELSIQNPGEEFYISCWYDDFYSSTKYTGVIKNGEYHETKVEPIYMFSYPSNLKVDSKLIDEFVQKITQYLDDVKYYKEDSDKIVYYNLPDNSPNKNGLKSYITFTWETEDHRFIAENKHDQLIEIKYESKDKENLKRLKRENEILKEQVNDTSEYPELPFQKII